MLIDNQQCGFSDAFTENLCPSGCQRGFVCVWFIYLFTPPPAVGCQASWQSRHLLVGAKTWQAVPVLSGAARRSRWKRRRRLASRQAEKYICGQRRPSADRGPARRSPLTGVEKRPADRSASPLHLRGGTGSFTRPRQKFPGLGL